MSHTPMPCPSCGKITGALTRHRVKCDKVQAILLRFKGVEGLRLAFDECRSVVEFQAKYQLVGTVWIYSMFKEFGIDCGFKRAGNHPSTKALREATMLDTYGVKSNMLGGCSLRKTWEDRLFQEEGITNVFQRESVKAKGKTTFLKRYKMERWQYSVTSRGRGVVSKLNQKVFEWLQSHAIPFEIEYKIDKPSGLYYAYDIIIQGTNRIIEVNGDYWHMNPKLYKSTDIYLKGRGGKEQTAEVKWASDANKQQFARDKGFHVLVIWEHEIKTDPEGSKRKVVEYACGKNHIY